MVAANKDWKLLNQWFLLPKLSHHFESLMVAIMTWLTVAEHLGDK
jgi:hypothetical protein